jgi:hypothetical protein
MRVILGSLVLWAVAGAVVLLITGEHVRGAWTWTAGPVWRDNAVGSFTVGVAAIVVLALLAMPWAREMDEFRTPWVAASGAAVALLVAAGVWSAFALWVLNAEIRRAADPSGTALWVAVIWFIGATLWLAYFVWDYARWRVLRRVERRDPTTPGIRSFAGRIVAAPGERMLRDPLYGGACVSWTADGTSEDVWRTNVGKHDEKTGYLEDHWVTSMRVLKDHTGIDGEASPFYVLIGDVFVYVRPDGVRMRGRAGDQAVVGSTRVGHHGLAQRVRELGLKYVRTRLLADGDGVVATGVIVSDATGRLTLQAKPVGRRAALVPKASVRVVGRGLGDRRHRRALHAGG